MNKDAIIVKDLKKEFVLPHAKKNTLKSVFVNPFKQISAEKQTAFKNVSFTIKKGEFFGIVGRNGSGKSTLLKCIAGVYTPSSGSIKINGTLVPFIELGVGFNPELSGRDNVYLNGALLGFTRREVNAMYDEIVEFAELEDFMDQLLKNYSSGMQVRLAFSIAIRAKSDILLLDEVLAVGDSAFQQKCYDYFNALKKEDRTVVLVSHNMQAVEQFCDRALLLENGKIKKIGNSTEVGELYETMFLREEAKKITETQTEGIDLIEVKSLNILQNGRPTDEVDAFEEFEIEIQIVSKIELEKANIGFNIKNHDKNLLIMTDTVANIGTVPLNKGRKKTVRFKINNSLTNGLYTVNIGVADCKESEKAARVVFKQESAGKFIVNGVMYHQKSLTHPKIGVTIV